MMQSKKVLLAIVGIIIVAVGIWYVATHRKSLVEAPISPQTGDTTNQVGISSIFNADIPDVYSGASSGTIHLKQGQFNGSFASLVGTKSVQTALSLSVNTDATSYAVVDLNGDGALDLVATISYSTGGTGQFTNLAVFINDGGVLKYKDSTFLGDRIVINRVGAIGTLISADIVTQGPGEAFCCGTLKKTIQYTFSGDMLTQTDTKIITDGSGKISFVYPASFAVNATPKTTQSWMQQSTSTGVLLASVTIPRTFQPQTNFSEATFTIGKSTDKGAVASCLAVPSGNPVSSSIVTMDNIQFFKFTYGDAGAGNFYDTTSYRTIRNNACYAIEYTIHSTNIGNYSPDQNIQLFDKAKITSILDSIVQSVMFK